MSDELVQVMVPRRHLEKVYGLLAGLGDSMTGDAPRAAPPGGVSSQALDEWTPPRVRTAVEQSPPAMLRILQALADRPGEWVSTKELGVAISGKKGADWKTVAGTLGAFARRARSRYGLKTLPFDGRHDHSEGCRVLRMDAALAKLFRNAINAKA